MKTLEKIAGQNPLYYADMASKANAENKSLSVKNGKLVLIETVQPELSIQEKRALAYPNIQEQLDMIYWDRVNGTDTWIETISAIKNKYPKEQR
jgi:hypothetical protein